MEISPPCSPASDFEESSSRIESEDEDITTTSRNKIADESLPSSPVDASPLMESPESRKSEVNYVEDDTLAAGFNLTSARDVGYDNSVEDLVLDFGDFRLDQPIRTHDRKRRFLIGDAQAAIIRRSFWGGQSDWDLPRFDSLYIANLRYDMRLGGTLRQALSIFQLLPQEYTQYNVHTREGYDRFCRRMILLLNSWICYISINARAPYFVRYLKMDSATKEWHWHFQALGREQLSTELNSVKFYVRYYLI